MPIPRLLHDSVEKKLEKTGEPLPPNTVLMGLLDCHLQHVVLAPQFILQVQNQTSSWIYGTSAHSLMTVSSAWH